MVIEVVVAIFAGLGYLFTTCDVLNLKGKSTLIIIINIKIKVAILA